MLPVLTTSVTPQRSGLLCRFYVKFNASFPSLSPPFQSLLFLSTYFHSLPFPYPTFPLPTNSFILPFPSTSFPFSSPSIPSSFLTLPSKITKYSLNTRGGHKRPQNMTLRTAKIRPEPALHLPTGVLQGTRQARVGLSAGCDSLDCDTQD